MMEVLTDTYSGAFTGEPRKERIVSKALETIRKTPCKYGIIHAQQMCTRCLQEENTKLQADYERERIRADDLWDTAKAQAGEIKRLKRYRTEAQKELTETNELCNAHAKEIERLNKCCDDIASGRKDNAEMASKYHADIKLLKGKNDE